MLSVRLFRIATVLVLAAGLPLQASAQSSVHATLSGRVSDPSGAAMAGASVSLSHAETGVVQSATTNAEGVYDFARVVPGRYVLEATSDGFGQVRQIIDLAVNDAAVVNLAVPLAAVASAVTVTAPIRPVSRSAAVSAVVTGDEMAELPVNNRDFQRLMALAPGVVTGTPRGTQNNPSVAGTRSSSNNYTLDGMSLNEEDGLEGVGAGANPGNSALSVPNMISTEALQEFRVVTSNADASFGRGAGGQVNVITKSGTNTLRGSAYEYYRNSKLDARDFFNQGPFFNSEGDPIPPPLTYNLFGATLGGPIARDRHFFFGSYEGFRQKEDLLQNLTLANAALIGLIPGDLGQMFRTVFLDSQVVPATGNPVGDFRPFSATDRAASTAAGFPAGLFDGNLNNDEAGVVVTTVPQPREYVQDALLLRTDHHLGDRLTGSARYARTRSRFERYLGRPGTLFNTDRDLDSVLAQAVTVLSQTQLLEIRGGWLRTDAPVCNLDIPTEFAGLSERGLGLSLIGTTAFTLPSAPVPCGFLQTETIPQVSAVHTWTRAGLTLRSGADIRGIRNSFGNNGLGRPTYTFTGLVGPAGLLGSGPGQAQAVATSLAATVFGGGDSPATPLRSYRSLQQEYFAQADWRISPHLTVDLGVRYSIFGMYRFEGASNLYAVDPTIGAVVPDVSPLQFGRTANRIELVDDERPLYQSDLNNVQPRLSVAWDLTGRGHTVIKGGYGIYHDRFFRFGFANIVGNVPGAVTGTAPMVPFALAPVTGSMINPATPTIFAMDPTVRNPYFHRTTIGVEQQLGGRTSVFAGYVGTFGRDLARIIGLNFGPGFPQALRPDPRFAEINLFTNVSTSRYDALQVYMRTNPLSGLNATLAYTYSRHTDFMFPDTIGLNQQIPMSLTNQGAWASSGFQVGSFTDRPLDAWAGRADQNLPHVLSASHLIDIPFGRGRRWGSSASAPLNALLGGWSFSGVLLARSGVNVNVLLGSDVDDDGFTFDRPELSSGSIEDLYSASGSRTQYLIPQAEALTRLGAPSDVTDPFLQVPYNALRAPFVVTYDISLQKQIPIGARVRLAVELNAFNVFNRVNLGSPNATLSSALFGTITSTTTPPRQLQLGGKLTF